MSHSDCTMSLLGGECMTFCTAGPLHAFSPSSCRGKAVSIMSMVWLSYGHSI